MSCRNYPHPSLSPVLSFPAASSAKTNPTETSLQTNKTEAEQSREPGFHTGFSESRAPTRGSLRAGLPRGVLSVSFVATTPCFTMTSKYTLLSAIIKSLPYYSQIYNGSFGGNNYKLFFSPLLKNKQAKPKKKTMKQNKTPTTITKTKTFPTTVNTTRAAGLLPSHRGWRLGQLSRGHVQSAGCALMTSFGSAFSVKNSSSPPLPCPPPQTQSCHPHSPSLCWLPSASCLLHAL